MSDGFQLRISSDSVSPDLRKLIALGGDTRPLMKAIGVGVVSLTKRAFNDPTLRPNAWPAKKDGSQATLKDTSTLWRSVRVVSAESGRVTVGSDRAYAAIHQLGGKKRPMPRRGYLPFDADGGITARGNEMVRDVCKSWVDSRGKLP